jgi:Mce-associated membrane protein
MTEKDSPAATRGAGRGDRGDRAEAAERIAPPEPAESAEPVDAAEPAEGAEPGDGAGRTDRARGVDGVARAEGGESADGTGRAGRSDRASRADTATPGRVDRADRVRGGRTKGDGAGRGAARRPVLLVAAVLALAAALAAAWTGWSWYGAAHDGDAAFARARDTVLAAGEQAVQNMNTLDHSDLAHGLDVWEASTTGDLHSQLVQGRDDFVKQVQLAQTDSTAKVLSGAVTELDTRAGKASVMVALRITVHAPKSQPSVKESRLLGELTRTPAGWKLSALGQAPMGDSASSGDGTSSAGSTSSAGATGATAPTTPASHAPATTKPASGR